MKISPSDILSHQDLDSLAMEGETDLERATHDTPRKVMLHDPIEFMDDYDPEYDRIWHNITNGNSVLGG